MRLKRHQLVASFTDAWIETVEGDIVLDTFMSHLLQMRGLKHIAHKYNYHCHMSHLLQMRGLKQQNAIMNIPDHSRIFYRCVD